MNTGAVGNPDARRALRRDARINRERILAATASTMAREGRNVPLATIAHVAGVGIGTFYRRYPDRAALLQDMEYRAYDLLIAILVRIKEMPQTGAAAVETFLIEALAIAEQLVLPLHGAPPLLEESAVRARRRIDGIVESFLADGRVDGSIRSDVNATDVIMCSALTTQPLRHGPDWDVTARRHIALFIAGLQAVNGNPLPGRPIQQTEIEAAFAASCDEQRQSQRVFDRRCTP
jgi:AcrR family transcriptional regulator